MDLIIYRAGDWNFSFSFPWFALQILLLFSLILLLLGSKKTEYSIICVANKTVKKSILHAFGFSFLGFLQTLWYKPVNRPLIGLWCVPLQIVWPIHSPLPGIPREWHPPEQWPAWPQQRQQTSCFQLPAGLSSQPLQSWRTLPLLCWPDLLPLLPRLVHVFPLYVTQ